MDPNKYDWHRHNVFHHLERAKEVFYHENEARGRGAYTTSEILSLARGSTSGVLEMEDDMNIANEEFIDNIASDEDTNEQQRYNQEAEVNNNASLVRRSGTESLHSDKPRQRRKVGHVYERLEDLMENVSRSLAAPLTINGRLENEDHRAIREAMNVLKERFSGESTALHMRMGEIWSKEPNRAVAFLESNKKVQKRIVKKEREALAAMEWGDDSDDSGRIWFREVGFLIMDYCRGWNPCCIWSSLKGLVFLCGV